MGFSDDSCFFHLPRKILVEQVRKGRVGLTFELGILQDIPGSV